MSIPPAVPSTQSRRALLATLCVLVVAAAVAVPLAERRALRAEQAHVADRLGTAACLDDWGVNEGAGPSREASVTGVTAGGLRVAVTLPYAYSTTDGGTVYADTASEAVYAVTLTDARRLGGETVDPC